MRPDYGGRLELKLVESTATTARYRVVVSTPGADHGSDAELSASGAAVEIGAWVPAAPPAWLEALARTLLRTVLRSQASAGEWPRRLARWRPEPSARGSESAD